MILDNSVASFVMPVSFADGMSSALSIIRSHILVSLSSFNTMPSLWIKSARL